MTLFTKKVPAPPVPEALLAEGWTLHSTKLWADVHDPLSGNTRNGYSERRVVWFEGMVYLFELVHQQVREYTGRTVPGPFGPEPETAFTGWNELVEWVTSSPDQMTRAERQSVARWERSHPPKGGRKGGCR